MAPLALRVPSEPQRDGHLPHGRQNQATEPAKQQSTTRAITPEEAARNWRAYREGERQKEMDHSHAAAAGFIRGPGVGGSSDAHDDEDEEKRRKGRSRDNDYGLE
jgi:hypothetical protein